MGSGITRHWAFVVAVAVGALIFVASLVLDLPLPFTLGADAFFLTYSGVILAGMPRMTAAYLKRHAQSADLPVLLIFAVTLVIIAATVAALFELINERGRPGTLQLVVALISLPLGWFTLQAMAAMHYAHLFWVGHRAEGSSSGGLDFPGDEPPIGTDFLYFATTIGMTAQTADVAIANTGMRRAVLVHATVSFFFNAVIVAAAVNLAVSLGG